MEQNRIERAPTLGARLQKCADFVREGKKLADIGTDHGYVPGLFAAKRQGYRLPLRLMFTKGRWKAP